MIESAAQFIALRETDRLRAMWEEAAESVWLDVLDKYPEYAIDVAWNKKLPNSILAILACHPQRQVRETIAAKRACPHDLLRQLAQDGDEGVRRCVAENPKAPKEILEMLQDDVSPIIAEKVRGRLHKLT